MFQRMSQSQSRWINFICLVLGLFGLAYALLIPPAQNPDEIWHMFRAFQVSEFSWGANQGSYEIPNNLYNELMRWTETYPFHPERKSSLVEISKSLKIPLASEHRTTIGFGTTSYPFFLYLPQVPGIWAARLFSPGALGLLYGARISAALFWVVGCFFILRICPFLTPFLVATFFLPTCLVQASAVSADATTVFIVLIVYSLIVRFVLENLKLRPLEKLSFKASISLLAAAKYIYAPMGALSVLIPVSSFNSQRDKFKFLLQCILIMIIFFICFKILGTFHTPTYAPLSDPKMNLQWAWANPFAFLSLFFHSLTSQFHFRVHELIGVFGHLDTFLPNGWYAFATLLLLLQILIPRHPLPHNRESYRLAAATLSISSLIYLGIYLGFFFVWTQIEKGYINGVQGRYFHPLVAPVLASMAILVQPLLSKAIQPSLKLRARLGILTLSGYVLLNLAGIAAILNRFFDYRF